MPEATFTWETKRIDPVRHSVSARLAVEDTMGNFAGLEQSVRSDLRMAFADSVSDRVINESARFSGVMDELTFAANPAAVFTWENLRDLVYNNVDGIRARSEGDIRFVMNPDMLGQMASKYRTGAADSETNGLMMLRALSGGVTTSAHMPKIAAKSAKIVGVKSNAQPTAVLGTWSGAQVIVDDYTAAQKGERIVTLRSLIGFKVIREDNFIPVTLRTAA